MFRDEIDLIESLIAKENQKKKDALDNKNLSAEQLENATKKANERIERYYSELKELRIRKIPLEGVP